MTWINAFAPEDAAAWCARIAALGTILASAEYLVQPALLADESLMSWEVSRLRATRLTIGPVARLLDKILSAKGAYGLLVFRLVAAAALLAFPTNVGLLLLVGFSTLLFLQRTPFGHDGADQLTMIVLLVLGLGAAVGSPLALKLSLGFVAAQSVLAYVSAGASKVVAPGWRDGTYLTGISGMRMYGHAGCAHLFADRPLLARVAAQATIAWEIGFIVLPFLPPGPGIAYLALGLFFHAGNALIMGLNTFVFAFLSTYPALLWWLMRG